MVSYQMDLIVKRATVIVFALAMIMAVFVGIARSQNYVDYLSPPTVASPIYDGAEIVSVAGFTPGAEIEIFANGVERIGKGSFWYGWWSFKVNRKLHEGDKITATQTIGGDTSYHTREPVIVKKKPADVLNKEALGRPSIIPPLYGCQQIVSVKDILEGAEVNVFSDDTLIGRAETAYNYAQVGTSQLNENDKIKANQTMCGKFKSPLSSDETVKSKPTSLPPPVVDENSIVDGGNTVVVTGLTTGALVEIYSDGTKIGGGIAPGPNVIFPVDPKLKKDSEIYATQALCEVISDKSSPKKVKDSLDTPTIEKPICGGSNRITICNTTLNAVLKIYVNGKQVGQGGATGNCTTLYIGDMIDLKDTDKVEVTQTIGTITSKYSDPVTVGEKTDPIVKVENGHPFFEPEAGEQAIPGPVFLRGVLTTASYGPVFKAIKCDAEKVIVNIIDPQREKIEKIPLVATNKGYFEGGWDWKHAGWERIPVGEYKAVFEIFSGTETKEVEKIFYVIFNPAEVTAPSAFALSDESEKGVFFNPDPGKDFAKSYALHPDDNRVFCLAIKGKDCPTNPANIKARVTQPGINGETDQFAATRKLYAIETSLFDFDTYYYHGTDVTHLLEKEQAAECYDDANMFTAILRSVGIPARPVAGDAAQETKGTWFFDTWTEARLKGTSGEQWYVLHPHYEPGGPVNYGPVNRGTAAGTWGVASEEDNDIIIAADGDWGSYAMEVDDGNPDVVFGYTSCNDANDPNWFEPNQNFNAHAKWLDHLCEDSYWNPKTHWTCSTPRRYAITISFDKERYQVSDTIQATVTASNPTEESVTGELVVDLVAHHPWSMAGEEILHKLRETITVAPGSIKSIKMIYQLPLNLNEADNYFVRATFADGYVTSPFMVVPLFKNELFLPNRVREGEEFRAELTITNPQEVTLKNISISLPLPIEVQALDKLDRQILQLEPGTKETLVWNLQALSRTVVTPLEFTITCENGGGTKIFKGIEILPTSSDEPVVAYIPEAKFKLGNLSVPARVRRGEILTLKIDITNIGEAISSTTVNLKVNNTVIGSKEVTLDVGETKSLAFTHTAENELGTYSVEVDGKTGKYEVTPGFEVIFAIAGLFAMVSLLRRKK